MMVVIVRTFRLKLFDNRTLIPCKIWLEKIKDYLKNKGHTLSHIAEMHNITFAIKKSSAYKFYIKHNMHAVQWKLNVMINKNRNYKNLFHRNWRHPLKRNFESYRV